MRSVLKSKKAQLGGITGIVITLLVIGLVLGIGFVVYDEIKEQVNEYSATVTLESITAPSTTTGSYVANVNATCFNTFVATALYNDSGGVNYGPVGTNWTYDADAGTIQNLTTITETGATYNVSYTYKYGTDACTAVESTEDAVGDIPGWLSIIALIAIVGILLAIVFGTLPTGGSSGGFSFGRKGGGGTIAEI
jgi:hypothetical protein